MHIFCRNCPKIPGALRGRHGIWGKGKCWEEHVDYYRTGDKREGDRRSQRAKKRCPLPDRHPAKTELSSKTRVRYKARNKVRERPKQRRKLHEKGSDVGLRIES